MMNEETKNLVVMCAHITEMRLRMAQPGGTRCADESTDWSKVDRAIAARYSEEAFRLAQEAAHEKA